MSVSCHRDEWLHTCVVQLQNRLVSFLSFVGVKNVDLLRISLSALQQSSEGGRLVVVGDRLFKLTTL